MKPFTLFASLLLHITVFSQSQALNQLVYEIRNPQTGRVPFRQALETIGEYLALQVLEELDTEKRFIQTLTGAEAKHNLLTESPVLVTILRAGLPLNNSVQKVFPDAEVGFLGMSRNEKTLKAETGYAALPDVTNRCVIISDTMLATGGSILDAIYLIEQGKPKKIVLIVAIASQYGIDQIRKSRPNIKIYAAAIDPTLNEKGYIIPGLGDAGDRAYGEKTPLHVHITDG